MATPKKTKSGKWHMRVYDHIDESGKQIYKSITANTRDECEQLALDFRKNRHKDRAKELTIGETVDMYIDLSEPTLAATTIQCYRRMRTHAFPDFWDLPVNSLTDISAQRIINQECKRLNRYGQPVKPKTVHEEWGLVSAALNKICHKQFHVTLPKRVRNIKDFPEPETVISAVINTSIELPCMLSIWLSFSMSELRGIRYSSIRNGRIFIERVRVHMSHEGDIIKDIAKVDTRNRKLDIPDYIQQLLNKDPGYLEYLRTGCDDWLIKESAHAIYMRFKRIMAKNNLDLTFHQLRHLNASIMGMLKIRDRCRRDRGGWKSNHIMETVYDHAFDSERLEADRDINDYFTKIINKTNTDPPA
jgi:hypothetical protein